MTVFQSRALHLVPLSMLMGGIATTVCACDRGVTATSVDASTAFAPPPAVPTRTPLSDADIAQAIKRHFGDERLLRLEHVQVTVAQGIATISGAASNLLAKRRALAVTESIRGVRSVVDTITVATLTRTDEQLRNDVTSELRHDLATSRYAIAVAVKDGTVTLTGKADSWAQRHLFEDVAEAVPGVKALVNDVALHYLVVRPESEILTDAKHRIANDVWLDADTLSVTVTGTTVHLSGIVGSVAEKTRAQRDAWVAGVEAVANEGIVVDWSARGDQRHTLDLPRRSDADIAQSVRDALRIDPRLKTLIPQVTVESGTVSLSGTVDSVKARRAAAADAKNTWGVWNIRDRVLVQPSSAATDADIESGAKRLLKDDLFLTDGQSIAVSSVKGRVTLSGTLGSGFERFGAIDDVESIPGVIEIDDELIVKRSPSEIKAEIEDRLFWDPMVEHDGITVTVAPDNVATLAGTLSTWSEIKAAADDSLLAGAKRVINLLKIRNHPEIVAP